MTSPGLSSQVTSRQLITPISNGIYLHHLGGIIRLTVFHQTRENAFGMCEDMYGPTSLRKNDLRLLGNSRLNARLFNLPNQFGTYGDSIYPQLTNVCSGGPNTEVWKRLRCSIEWNYHVTSYDLFQLLSQFHKLRLLSSDRVAKFYTVATFLRNCHVAMYGGNCMKYFKLRLPENMLERYTILV